MPQALITVQSLHGDQFAVEGREAHHLTRVLKVKAGQNISLFTGQGQRYEGRIEHVDSRAPLVSGRIIKSIPERQCPYQFHLIQGLPRGSKFDYVIEKFTELGGDVIVPFLSQKNLIKLTPQQYPGKVNRWNRLSVAAAKQSGRSTLLVVEEPRPLAELEDRLRQGTVYVFHPSVPSVSLKNLLKNNPPAPGLIQLVVGPESGFSKTELDGLGQWGVTFVSFLNLTLRTETAGQVALSVLKYELGLI